MKGILMAKTSEYPHIDAMTSSQLDAHIFHCDEFFEHKYAVKVRNQRSKDARKLARTAHGRKRRASA
jgi:hypothetical protein